MPEQSSKNGNEGATKPYETIDPEETKKAWDTAWKEYLDERKRKGLDDPARLPSDNAMSRKCNV